MERRLEGGEMELKKVFNSNKVVLKIAILLGVILLYSIPLTNDLYC